jgi:hypothetical protein
LNFYKSATSKKQECVVKSGIIFSLFVFLFQNISAYEGSGNTYCIPVYVQASRAYVPPADHSCKSEFGIKEGDICDLDGLHGDHIEVFMGNYEGNPRQVLSVDGRPLPEKLAKAKAKGRTYVPFK